MGIKKKMQWVEEEVQVEDGPSTKENVRHAFFGVSASRAFTCAQFRSNASIFF